MSSTQKLNGVLNAPHVLVQRTWKRNGDTNLMQMQFAIANLQSNFAKQEQKTTPKGLENRLLDGETIETIHAEFTLLGIG